MSLFLDILDPTFLVIRGPPSAAPPPGIAAYLNTPIVGGNQLDDGLSTAPIHPVRRNAAEAPVPDMHQLADQDAGVARAALMGWAADRGHVIWTFCALRSEQMGFLAWL